MVDLNGCSLQKERETFNPYKAYGKSNPTRFTLEIHHEGFFTKGSGRRYMNGKVSWFDSVDIDEFSVIELRDMFMKLGYKEQDTMFFHCRIPNADLDSGLLPLDCDSGVLNLAKYVGNHKVIELYMELRLSSLDVTERSFKKPKVTFEGLDVPQQSKTIVIDEDVSKNSGDVRGQSIGINKQLDEDSDYMEDEENPIDDVEVDMGDFRNNIDKNIEWIGFSEEEVENIEVGTDEELDLEDLDSATDSEGDFEAKRNKALRKLSKKKDPLKKRQLHLDRNDKTRVRVICRGKTPVFTMPDTNKASGSGESDTQSKQGALKKGFKARNKELLGLDGCFLSGPWPGQILTVVGVDPNNGTYPVAYAIVESETKDSWSWFLECLRGDLDLNRRSNFTFVSDRQKGIIPALASIFPSAEHRFCLKHIYDNMELVWRGELYKDFLWKYATARTIQSFDKYMEELKGTSKDAYLWLKMIPPCHWSSNCISGRAHYDVLLNNMCEELTGMPCKHSVATINDMGNNGIQVGIPEAWSSISLILTPPDYHTPIGRPPKKRKKSASELSDTMVKNGNLSRSGKTITCTICKKLGHNQRSCKQKKAKLWPLSSASPSSRGCHLHTITTFTNRHTPRLSPPSLPHRHQDHPVTTTSLLRLPSLNRHHHLHPIAADATTAATRHTPPSSPPSTHLHHHLITTSTDTHHSISALPHLHLLATTSAIATITTAVTTTGCVRFSCHHRCVWKSPPPQGCVWQ
nr:transposase, mutator type [Tanacetum cinerariifolium]